METTKRSANVLTALQYANLIGWLKEVGFEQAWKSTAHELAVDCMAITGMSLTHNNMETARRQLFPRVSLAKAPKAETFDRVWAKGVELRLEALEAAVSLMRKNQACLPY